MSPGGNLRRQQQQLLCGAASENIGAIKAALKAGANVNGCPDQPLVPIVVAALAGHAGPGTVSFLFEQGADPDMPVTEDMLSPGSATATVALRGERALHIAARNENVELVRLLLKRLRADPNATDSRGRTPLMATCRSSRVCVEVVQLLLEADADPAMAKGTGFTPLHMVAANGHTDLVDILLSKAPATLNRYSSNGQTPLFLACKNGHDNMVSKLLSIGAMQRTPLTKNSRCPLKVAVGQGLVGVVRVLTSEGGITAVGSEVPLAQSLYFAAHIGQATILRLLLTAVGEKRRSGWANISYQGRHLLHSGVFSCYPAAVSVLLQAGADEAARDSKGRIPRDVVGVSIGLDNETQMDRAKNVTIRRMLQRGPAYRARSWAWPSDEEADAGGSGDGDTPSAAASAAAAVFSYPTAAKQPGLRIFRPKGRSNFFVQLVGRFCGKD